MITPKKHRPADGILRLTMKQFCSLKDSIMSADIHSFEYKQTEVMVVLELL